MLCKFSTELTTNKICRCFASSKQTSLSRRSQVLNFSKREMLAGDCAKGASVLCLLCRRRQTILGGSEGMLPRNFFEMYTSRIAGNSLSSPPFCFFHAACQESPCYYGQPELTYRPIIHILTGESTSWRNKKIGRTQTDWTLTMKWYMKMDHIWTADMKSSEAMILAVMNAIFAIA